MRNTLTLIVTLIAITSFGQSAQEFLESGIEKENQQKHKEAIKDFTNAIKKDPNLAEAFFARGTVKMNISDLSGALDDFNEAIRIDPRKLGFHPRTQKQNTYVRINERHQTIYLKRFDHYSSLTEN
jgi:tetratricopeptide (TPR) repeat protein